MSRPIDTTTPLVGNERTIYDKYITGEYTMRELADEYGVNTSSISRAIDRVIKNINNVDNTVSGVIIRKMKRGKI